MLMRYIRNIRCCQKVFQMQGGGVGGAETFNPFFYEYPALQPISSVSDEAGSPQEMVCRSCSVTFLDSLLWDARFQNVFSFNLSLPPPWYPGIWPCRISFFQNGASFPGSKLGSLHFLLFWLFMKSCNFIAQQASQQFALSLPLAMQTVSNDSKSTLSITRDHCSCQSCCLPWQALRTQISNERTNSPYYFLNI